MKLRALTNKILCSEIQRGQTTLASGIIIPDDDGRDTGIRPRWMQVYAIGPEVSKEIKIGMWILVEHGRWSHGHIIRDDNNQEFTLWQAEEESILCASDEEPSKEYS